MKHRLPHLSIAWHACADRPVESGSCVRSSLRNRSPYGDVLGSIREIVFGIAIKQCFLRKEMEAV